MGQGDTQGRAEWIWSHRSDDEPNLHLRFRRSFIVETPGDAHIDVAADSRYVLYVNGNRLGVGPAKGFAWRRFFDTYDLSPLLIPGENIIGALVTRFGLSSGRYDGGPGGFWCRGEIGGVSFVSDASWQVSESTCKERRVRRMAYSMEFIDIHDMRGEDGWLTKGYATGAAWEPAVVHASAGVSDPVPRGIPPLTRTERYPVAILDTRCVVKPGVGLALDLLRHTRAVGITDEVTGPIGGYLVTRLVAGANCEVSMERMNPSFDLDTFGSMKVNTIPVSFDALGCATFRAHEGSNFVVVRLERRGQSFPSWRLHAPTSLSFRAPHPFADSPMAVMIGPEGVLPEIFEGADPATFARYASRFAPIRPDEVLEDPFADTWSAEAHPDGTVNVSEAASMLDGGQASASLWLSRRANRGADSADAVDFGDAAAELLFDFGEETVGYVGFSMCAPAGTTVDLVGFESFRKGERNRTDNLNNSVRVRLREGWNDFLSITRLGLRYLVMTIRGAEGPVRIRRVCVERAVYPVSQIGTFDCSDSSLARIWRMGALTVELCMDDTYVDCPAYEAAFWVGDMRNEAIVARTAFGETLLTLHSLELAADSLRRSELVECVVPSGNHRIIPNWSMLWMVAAEEYYRATGDKEGVARLWPAVKQQANVIATHVDGTGLFRLTDWNMMDWAAMDTPVGCYPATESGWAARALDAAGVLAGIMGERGDVEHAKRWAATSARIRDAVNRTLWDEDVGGYRDSVYADGTPGCGFSQQTQIVLLITGCVPDARRDRIAASIDAAPAGWTEVASPWMMWFRFEAMALLNRHDAILDTIREYWGEMVRRGATTCWETFSSYFEGRWEPTRSWCHGWSAAPTHFLSRYVLGVRQDDAGGESVTIEPIPGGLTWARGRVPTRRGLVEVSWRVEGDTFTLDVTAPEGVHVTRLVPEGLAACNAAIRT